MPRIGQVRGFSIDGRLNARVCVGVFTASLIGIILDEKERGFIGIMWSVFAGLVVGLAKSFLQSLQEAKND